MKKKPFAVLGITAALLLCAPALPATADEIVIPKPGSAVTIKGAPGMVTPNAVVIMDGTLSGSTTTRITPPGGTNAGAKVSFSTKANFGSTPITTAVLSGTSSALWQGFSPAKASKIKLADKFWSTGVGLSVSYPGGVGVALTSSSVKITTTANNTYRNTHSISNLKFHGALFTVNQEATGTFTFGSYTATVYAD